MDDEIAKLPISEQDSAFNAAFLESSARLLVHLHLFEFLHSVVVVLRVLNKDTQLVLNARLLAPSLQFLTQLCYQISTWGRRLSYIWDC